MNEKQRLEIIDVARSLLNELGVSELIVVNQNQNGRIRCVIQSYDLDVYFSIECCCLDSFSVSVGWCVIVWLKGVRKESTKLFLLGRFLKRGRAQRYIKEGVLIAATKRYLPKVQDELVEEIKKVRDDERTAS